MNSEPSFPAGTAIVEIPCENGFLPSLCWSAIIGGSIAAMGIHILLTALGVGAGLATFAPMTDTNPVAHFNYGAAAVWTLCALVALLFGGFVAGRFSHSVNSGFIHGMLVWCVTLVITILLLSVGTGMVLGGALKVLGEGIGIGGRAVAAGVGELANEAGKRVGGQLESFIDEAVQSGSTNTTPQAMTRAKREIAFAITRLYAPGNDPASAENRTAAIKTMAEYSGMSEAEATKTLDAWTASYKSLKIELDRTKELAAKQARELADVAARNLSCAAIWSFFVLLLGMLVASFAGSYGAGHALRRRALKI